MIIQIAGTEELKIGSNGTGHVWLPHSYNGAEVEAVIASVSPLYTESSPYVINESGLVGWWRLDENSGISVQDYLMNRDNSTLVGNWTTGKYNAAGKFDGADDRVTLPTRINGTRNMNFIVWCNVSEAKSASTLIVDDEPTVQRDFRFMFNGLKPSFATADGTNAVVTNFDSSVPLNKWEFLALTVSNTTLKLYISDTDGNIQNETKITTIPITPTCAGTTKIGGLGSSYPQTMFNGSIG